MLCTVPTQWAHYNNNSQVDMLLFAHTPLCFVLSREAVNINFIAIVWPNQRIDSCSSPNNTSMLTALYMYYRGSNVFFVKNIDNLISELQVVRSIFQLKHGIVCTSRYMSIYSTVPTCLSNIQHLSSGL